MLIMRQRALFPTKTSVNCGRTDKNTFPPAMIIPLDRINFLHLTQMLPVQQSFYKFTRIRIRENMKSNSDPFTLSVLAPTVTP